MSKISSDTKSTLQSTETHPARATSLASKGCLPGPIGFEDVFSKVKTPGGGCYGQPTEAPLRSEQISASADSKIAPSKPSGSASTSNERYTEVPPGLMGEIEAGNATLAQGSKGPEVKEIQRLMLAHGADLKKYDADGRVLKDYKDDGFYGEVTTREIKKLQEKWGFEPTGEVDKTTLTFLGLDPKMVAPEEPVVLEFRAATPANEKAESSPKLVAPAELDAQLAKAVPRAKGALKRRRAMIQSELDGTRSKAPETEATITKAYDLIYRRGAPMRL